MHDRQHIQNSSAYFSFYLLTETSTHINLQAVESYAHNVKNKQENICNYVI